MRRRLAADLALGGCEQDSMLVREVLVERADAHPGALGDTGGGQSGWTIALQNLSRGFQKIASQVARDRDCVGLRR